MVSVFCFFRELDSEVEHSPPLSCTRFAQVDLGSAFRAVAASKVFRRAYQFLSTGSTARSSGSKGGDYDGNRIREAISDYPDDDGKNDFVPKRSLRQQQQSIRAKPRKSILGRVIWEEDLQRERESRLVACGCSKTSPRPSGNL